MERVGDRQGKMEGYCSTGQSPQWAAVPIEEEEVQQLYHVAVCVTLCTLTSSVSVFCCVVTAVIIAHYF